MKKIKGGGFWITFWVLSLATVVVAKSMSADKASVMLNGVGRASWENKPGKSLEKNEESLNNSDNSESISSKDLRAFYTKFYEI